MPTDYLFRVGAGGHFRSSARKGIWGVNSNGLPTKGVLRNIRDGDRMWFIPNKTQGLLLAVATYRSHNGRLHSNEELGWTQEEGSWDVELNFDNLLWLDHLNLRTRFKGFATACRYNPATSQVDLPTTYAGLHPAGGEGDVVFED